MKKWIISACLILILFLAISYLFIPGKIAVSNSISVNANQTGVFRFLIGDSNWKKWWPGSSVINETHETVLETRGYRFQKHKLLYNAFEISIEKNNFSEKSVLNIFSFGKDSIKIEWNAIINTSNNPFQRINSYFKARNVSALLDVILNALQNYISDVRHIYGIDIRKEKVKVEYLVSTKKSFSHYPDTKEIYEMIDQIKKYISFKQAKEDDYPMLNITTSDNTGFDVQVAIPVNRQLADNGSFSSKKMLRFGNILVAEISGGKNVADSAMKQMEQYVLDYQYSNIALPFQSLITDRTIITDSSKWISKIYYPIR